MFLLKDFEGEILYYFVPSSLLVFIGAADCKNLSLFTTRLNTLAVAVVMILRVWAMYNRSMLILGMLLVFYTIAVISNLVICVTRSKDAGM